MLNHLSSTQILSLIIPTTLPFLDVFYERFGLALSLLESGDKKGFVEQFMKVGAWFGDYAKKCLVDSKQMLLKADDGQLLRDNKYSVSAT